MTWLTGTLRVGDLLGNKYRLERVLDTGGMSVVLAATHEFLRGRVAIKLLVRERGDERRSVRRFLREARWAIELRSPHVARVYDVDALDDGTPYIVMELLEGLSLGRHLLDRGPLPPHEAVGWARQACHALTEAHGRGIVHRDLKPANLFLARGRDGAFTLKVLDFGIAKCINASTSDPITAEGSLLGSPSYMAPEQIGAPGSVDARADIWALGVLLFEILSGQKPFSSPSLPETLSQVLRADPPDLLELCPGLPHGLVAVIRRCLEKDRERRFESADALDRALAPFSVAPKASPPPLPPARPASPLSPRCPPAWAGQRVSSLADTLTMLPPSPPRLAQATPPPATVFNTAPLAFRPAQALYACPLGPSAPPSFGPPPRPAHPSPRTPGEAPVQRGGSVAPCTFEPTVTLRKGAAVLPYARRLPGYWLPLVACLLASFVLAAFVRRYAAPVPSKAPLHLPSTSMPNKPGGRVR